MDADSKSTQNKNPDAEELGYGSPTPEQETGGLQGSVPNQQNDANETSFGDGLDNDRPSQMPESEQDSSSDGELGAGPLGGTDDQYLEEQKLAADTVQLPSADAPIVEGVNQSSSPDRESFSSEDDSDNPQEN